MAVETKIGLVVGLGFITCFAVVLSHRGSGDQLSARMAYDVLSKQNVTAPPDPIAPPETYARRQARERQAHDTPSERRRRSGESQARENRQRSKTNHNTGVKRRSSTPSSGERNKKTTRSAGRQRARDAAVTKRTGAAKKQVGGEGVANGSQGARNAGETARQSKKGLPSFEALFGGVSGGRDEIEENAKRQAAVQTARHATTRRAPTNSTNRRKRSGNSGVDGRSLNRATTSRQKIDSRAGDVPQVAKNPRRPKKTTTERKARSKPPVDDVKTDRKPAPPARYVVKPKDTLWRISERMYGAGSRRIVDAILAANKDRLTSAKQLRVGVELVLPAIDGVGAAKLAGGQRTEQTSKLASEPERPRFYQIQNGDRYSTIAERFLGSKSRWKEIHEMNKDIFPDPEKIRYGVRIRLPSSALLASAS